MAVGNGLRERSRERRRAAIEQAALRLFAERGYETTTLAQVAEAAEVSPRTVSLYFPSKLDLALSYPTAGTARLAAAVARRGRAARLSTRSATGSMPSIATFATRSISSDACLRKIPSCAARRPWQWRITNSS